jgi:hypothetical protein
MTADVLTIRGPAYRAFHYAMIVVVTAAAVAVAGVIALGVRERLQPDERVKAVRFVSNDEKVVGAFSRIERTADGMDFTFTTSGLPLGHVVTLRAEVFNHPEHCSHGIPPLKCGEQDLGDPAVEGSVVFMASSFQRATDTTTFLGRLPANDASRAISGRGLTNPLVAAIHLIVMDHGPALPDNFHDQSTTLGAGCTNPPPGAGAPGPNTCTDLQYAVHE